MNILVVDDVGNDLLDLRASLKLLPMEPWTTDVQFSEIKSEHIVSCTYGGIAGIAVNLYLKNRSGINLAGDVVDATKNGMPILLVAGVDKSVVPWSVRSFVDGVVFTADEGPDEDNAYAWGMRVFLRHCWRLEQARKAMPL